MLSWWSWKSKGGGWLDKIWEQMGYHQFQSLLGTNRKGNNPYYNSTSDIQKFQQWIQYPSPMSEQIEYQFCHKYYGISLTGSNQETSTESSTSQLKKWKAIILQKHFKGIVLHPL